MGAAVASATVVASEVLADFLNSLVEPPIPTQLKGPALRAAASLDTDALLALPMQLDQAVSYAAQDCACCAISNHQTDANLNVAVLVAISLIRCSCKRQHSGVFAEIIAGACKTPGASFMNAIVV